MSLDSGLLWRRAVGFGRYLRETWLERAWRARRRRADLRTLLSLDDRLLDDIGLRRADLRAVLYDIMPWEEAAETPGEGRATDCACILPLGWQARASSGAPDLCKAA